jgi:hypothetical protein
VAGQPALEIEGLKEFRKELKAVDAAWPKAMQQAHKAISQEVAEAARGRASGMGGVQAKAAGAIKGYATAVQASAGFPSGGVAGAAFWGTLRHTGWYAARRYSASSRRQHPIWVGNSWEPGVAGQGPYAINDAIASDIDGIVDKFDAAIDDLVARAFPD